MSNNQPDKFRKAFLPPLNLAILDKLTHMANPSHEVTVINDVVEEIDFNAECDLVGITALTAQSARAYQIADTFRKRGTKVVLGGIHPSMLPEEALEHADSIVVGEAENVWDQLISDAENGKLRQQYQDDNYPDLKELIIPKWDNFNLSLYRRSFGRKYPRMPIFTTRGCIHNCKYCSVTKYFGRSYRYKPIAHVIEEIKKIKAERYFFTDDNIICNSDYSESLFKALISSTDGIRWMSQCSTNILKRHQLIELAGRAGCTSMLFGVESINKKNLKHMKKSFNDPEKFVELHRRCLEFGIQPIFSIIFGLDYDLIENMWDTLNYLKKHNIWNVFFWILTPLPGTDLFNEMVTAGRILHFDWSKYDLNNVVFNPINYSSDDLYRNFWALYQSFFSLSNIFIKLRSNHKPEKVIEYYVTFLMNQYYSRQQVRGHRHPISMGFSKA